MAVPVKLVLSDQLLMTETFHDYKNVIQMYNIHVKHDTRRPMDNIIK